MARLQDNRKLKYTFFILSITYYTYIIILLSPNTQKPIRQTPKMNSDKSIPTNVDKMLWSVSRYIGYVVFTKYGDSIFCEVPSHIVAIPELGTSVGI